MITEHEICIRLNIYGICEGKFYHELDHVYSRIPKQNAESQRSQRFWKLL